MEKLLFFFFSFFQQGMHKYGLRKWKWPQTAYFHLFFFFFSIDRRKIAIFVINWAWVIMIVNIIMSQVQKPKFMSVPKKTCFIIHQQGKTWLGKREYFLCIFKKNWQLRIYSSLTIVSYFLYKHVLNVFYRKRW